MKISTLKDLKDFLDTLSDEQLSEPAILQGIDRGGRTIGSAGTYEEDYFVNDEGMDPVSAFEPFDEEDKIEGYKIVKAGTPWICEAE